ncbi:MULTISPECIES: FHA domain-containing protein [unclassified Rothia (in: high G+C Gram-positive bacteria)]|uniref:FHA domain-containing protein n=1 Tax=unclassified Rothia (in: high G+C Gram-positive bacteria) TaxID=2689056 RepID=UPI0019563913|nr:MULTISPECIES: FHA domain-containing protein [unclassified Rothia (in: high G+C Gram-positive bacteria)]MBM7050782.1 FHA domain-containing protein [Rothia sp. ZJ1223]QRZ60957.1 FHA domain-containing protein [Rothia sp. ZJ932]
MVQNPDAHPATSTLSMIRFTPSPAQNTSYSLSPEEQNTIATLPAGSALLIGIEGHTTGTRFLLTVEQDATGADKAIVAGRKPTSEIFLDDVTVSREHAVFTPNVGTFVLTDANSLNGTYVNGDRVDNAFLKNGDEIRIGKFHFVFFLGLGQQ